MVVVCITTGLDECVGVSCKFVSATLTTHAETVLLWGTREKEK